MCGNRREIPGRPNRPAVGMHSLNWKVRSRSGLSHGEQFFVKAADLAGAVDEVYFENPVALLAVGVGIAHAHGVAGMNVQADLIVREYARVEIGRSSVRQWGRQIPSHSLSLIFRAW